MAMIKCSECKAEISNKAKACPKCGASTPARTSPVTLFVLVCIVAGVVYAMVRSGINDSKESARQVTEQAAEQARIAALTPEQRAAEIKRAQEANAAAQAAKEEKAMNFLRAQTAVMMLKQATRDPSSFKLESVEVMKGGSVCIGYGARNGFGGMNRESAVLTAKGTFKVWDSDGFTSTWNRSCAGKSGTDFTELVQSVLDSKAGGG